MFRGLAAWLGLTLAGMGFLQVQASGRLSARGASRAASALAQVPAQTVALPRPAHDSTLLTRYCIGCHNDKLKTAGLALDTLSLDSVGDATVVWEKVAWKL